MLKGETKQHLLLLKKEKEILLGEVAEQDSTLTCLSVPLSICLDFRRTWVSRTDRYVAAGVEGVSLLCLVSLVTGLGSHSGAGVRSAVSKAGYLWFIKGLKPGSVGCRLWLQDNLLWYKGTPYSHHFQGTDEVYKIILDL